MCACPPSRASYSLTVSAVVQCCGSFSKTAGSMCAPADIPLMQPVSHIVCLHHCPSLLPAGARVTWRYSVLSNMMLMFAAPPAASRSALPLLRHCLALLRSDMLLLRQIGGTGLWLLMTQLAHRGVENGKLLQELQQVRMLGIRHIGSDVVGGLCWM